MNPLMMFLVGVGVALLGWLLAPQYRQPLKEILLTMLRPGHGLAYTAICVVSLIIFVKFGGTIGAVSAGIMGVFWFALCWMETWYHNK